jgi:hypothetical protein
MLVSSKTNLRTGMSDTLLSSPRLSETHITVNRPIPLQRHLEDFPGAKAPRTPNFNPSDEYQVNAGGWVKDLLPMNNSAINFVDFVYRSRLQALAGIDEIITDVVALLERKGAIDNTYSMLMNPSHRQFTAYFGILTDEV